MSEEKQKRIEKNILIKGANSIDFLTPRDELIFLVVSDEKKVARVMFFFRLSFHTRYSSSKEFFVCLPKKKKAQKERKKIWRRKKEEKNNSVVFSHRGEHRRSPQLYHHETETETETERFCAFVVAKKKKKTTTGFERERSDARETKRTASVWGNALIMNSSDIKTRLRKEYETPSTCTTHVALTLVQLIFALMHTLANPSLKHIPSFAFCTLRLAIALPFLYFFGRMEKPTQTKDISWKQRFWFVPMGTFLGIAYLLVFVCNERSGAIAVASVQPLMPVCTAMLSFAFGLERMCFLKAFGCLLGFAGTVLAVRAHRIFDEVGPSVEDVLLLLLQTCSYSFYVVMVVKATKSGMKNYGMTFLFRATLFAWTWIFFAGGLKQIFIDIDWENEVPAYAWGGVLFSGFGSAVIAHGINSWAITRVNGVLPTVYSGVQVAFTVLFGLTFLDESLEAIQFAGIAITVVGVYCVARSRAEEREEIISSATTTETTETETTTPTADAQRQKDDDDVELVELVVAVPDAVPHRPSLDL